MPATIGSTISPTTWWYGRGRAVDATRCLEGLYALPTPPGPVGAVTVSHGQLTVAFTAPLRAPLPPPWQPGGGEVSIAWDEIPTGATPDAQHPVCLVAFGITGQADLLVLNLAAFARLRVGGDRGIARALAGRWMLEIVTTHPATKIGVTSDLWAGPYTSRIRPAALGRVPDVDILMIGADLPYAERAHIAAAAKAPILIDFGDDAAASAMWTISCAADQQAQISNGRNTLTATVLAPSEDVVDLCGGLLSAAPLGPPPPAADLSVIDPADAWADLDEDDEDTVSDEGEFVDFFADQDVTPTPAPDIPGDSWNASPPPPPFEPPEPPEPASPEPPTAEPDMPAATEPDQGPTAEPTPDGDADPPASATSAPVSKPEADAPVGPPEPTRQAIDEKRLQEGPAVPVAPLWNTILGEVRLHPPAGGAAGNREKRLNELTVFLQRRRFASVQEIIDGPLSGGAAEKTVTQQMSLLRTRLGTTPAGRKALPQMQDGDYHLDHSVRSDWQEFDELLDILVERTELPRLIAAMDLVTAPLLSGLSPGDWKWANDLRDEIRGRVSDAAAALAQRHQESGRHPEALAVAEKGLWYDPDRQDLWKLALTAALDGKDADAVRDLRNRYLAQVPSADRRSDVLALTGR